MDDNQINNNANDNDLLTFQMKKLAEEHDPQLPAARAIWWRAQIVAKQQRKERVERPLLAMQAVAAVFCVAMFFAYSFQERLQFNFAVQLFNDPTVTYMAVPALAFAGMAAVLKYFFFPRSKALSSSTQ